MADQRQWKHITEYDKSYKGYSWIRDFDGNIHTAYYMVWNEGHPDGEYHEWRDDNDQRYGFDQHQWWAKKE